MIKWHPPDKDFVKLNFDGYVAEGKAVVDFAIRDIMKFLLLVGL